MSSPKDPVKQSDLIYEMDAYSKYFSKMLLRRAVKAPFMNIVRILRLVTFQFSKNHYRLKHLRDKYEGKRCFIVGNGPSLTIEDLDKLKGEHCFAFNKIYEVFDKTDWRPEFYMVLDNDVIKTTATHIEKVQAKFKILNVMGKVVGLKEDDSTIFFCSYGWYRIREFAYKKKHISKDISQYISLNFTVTCAAIETAIYLGFKEIVLVGIDNSFSRWIDEKGVVHNKDVENYRLTSPHQFQSLCYLDAVNSCYRCYCDYAQKNNIKILNATKGGSLEVFERIDLDKALEMPESFLNPNEKFFNSNEEIQRGVLDKMTEQFRQALCQVMELIERSHIVIPDEATVELYHHEGIEKFLNVGAAFIRIVNGEYCKSYVVQLPGQHYPDHYHKIKIETFYVIWGELIVNCEGVTSVLKPAGIRTIQRGESHSFFTETGAVFEELSTTYLNNDSVYSEESIQRSTYDFRKTMISFRKLKEVSENE